MEEALEDYPHFCCQEIRAAYLKVELKEVVVDIHDHLQAELHCRACGHHTTDIRMIRVQGEARVVIPLSLLEIDEAPLG
jgi:hypothetical protein